MASEEEKKEVLLKRVYIEGCPGCRMEQKILVSTGKPYLEFFYVWVITICTALPISSLFPFVYFMVRDFHIAKVEEDIGFYAGFVGSSFMVGRALTSIFWGLMADRYGRKPVIVIGTVSVIIFNTLFGLSVNYWMAIITRFLLGSLNGIIGPIMAYSIEVCRTEYQALGLSVISTAWGIGLIIGPAIGGYLAQPAEKYSRLFSEDSIFGRFPYFLPCLCISFFAVGALIVCFWLPETLHMHNESKLREGIVEDLETPCSSVLEKKDEETEKGHSDESLLKNWPLVSCITIYCVFSLHDMAYTEIFSIWTESDKKYGGLSFSSGDVGQALTISGFSLMVFQLFIYPRFVKFLGPIMSSRVASMLSIPLLAAYPFMTNLSGIGLVVIVNCASLLKNVLSVFLMLAGSAGGGLPPHGPPFRLPADCEAGVEADFHDDDDDADNGGPSAARPKPPRGRALGKEILLKVATTGPIPVRFDTNLNTRKALGRTGQLYYSGIGIQVRDNCDPSYREWVNVPEEQKNLTFRKLADWFILDFADPLVSQTVNRDAGLRYKDWKNTLHAHFKKYGGRNNPSLARSRVPKSIRDPAYWDRCIERFCSETFQRHSTSTTKNRALNTDGGRHGRISMLEHMERTLDPVTQQPRPIIENWESLHTNPDGTWTHESAQRKAAALRERVTQASSSGAAINEAAIVEEVLGRSRGFRTGIGPTLTRSSASEQSVGTGQDTSQAVTEKWIARAEKSEARAKKSEIRAKKSEAQVRKLLAFITQQFPGASMPATPPVSDDSDDDATTDDQ